MKTKSEVVTSVVLLKCSTRIALAFYFKPKDGRMSVIGDCMVCLFLGLGTFMFGSRKAPIQAIFDGKVYFLNLIFFFMENLVINDGTNTIQKTKVSSQESGHARNVANFDRLLTYVASFGAEYNPSFSGLQLASLQQVAADAKVAMTNVSTTQTANTLIVSEREQVFEGLNKLVTKIMFTLKAYEPSKSVLEDAWIYARKVKGIRVKPKKDAEELAALAAQDIVVTQHSVSQLSYDYKIENFTKLVSLLEGIRSYDPNEEAIKVRTLHTLLDTFKAKNEQINQAKTALSTARLERNAKLYHPETGLVSVAKRVKNYLRSVYGLQSGQYRQVIRLNFYGQKFA